MSSRQTPSTLVVFAPVLLALLSACGPKMPKDSLAHSDSASSAGTPTADTGPSSPGTWLDLAYTTPSGTDSPTARLDLYQSSGTSLQPLVMLVHGGSWVSGDKANFSGAAPHFIPWWLSRGYTVAAVNFRLASPVSEELTVSPKDQAADIAHALAWLHAHSEDYSLSTEATVLVGYSSGAHLVALLGADESYVEAAGLTEDSITATVSLDVHAYDVPYALSLMVGSEVERNIPLIEHLFGESEEAQLSASPIAFTEGWVAPAMLVSVGPDPEEDGTHGYIVHHTAERYAAALHSAGHQATTFHDSSESHDSLAIGFGEAGDAVTQVVGDFLTGL